MKYMQLNPGQRNTYLESLAGMPVFLENFLSGLSQESILLNGPGGEFSPVEQVWHLADLEDEGFYQRIQALLDGEAVSLPDFDGDRIARERNYKSLSVSAGLEKFRAARSRNIDIFRDLDTDDWLQAGYLEGVGPITLCDMPSILYQHDAAHRSEIEKWQLHTPGTTR